MIVESGAFQRLTAWCNLLTAYHNASRGKRGKVEVARFESRLEDNLFELQTQLRLGTWQPKAYHHFYIHDPKRRLISAAPFADRVVHHALCQIIEPAFEKSFVHESFANRVGKGNHRALDHAQHCARHHAYVLQLDVQRFFPSIDHAILHSLLAQKIHDDRIIDVIGRILVGGGDFPENASPFVFPGDDLLALMRPRGLPIGNLTSQFWANVYLNPLDHCIKRELPCQAYVRYVDDLLLFADSKSDLWDWKAHIEQRMQALRLRLHPHAQARPVSEGFGYLGFRVFAHKRRLKPRKGYQYQRQMTKMLREHAKGTLSKENMQSSVTAWNNHLGFANTIGLRKALFTKLPAEWADAWRLPIDDSNQKPLQ